jgi:hypothetical protein
MMIKSASDPGAPVCPIHVDASESYPDSTFWVAQGGGAGDSMRSAAKCAAELSCWAAAKRLLRLALWDVIDPRCSFRKRWDVLMVLQLVFLVLEVPYVVCFGIQYRWGYTGGINGGCTRRRLFMRA